MYSASDYRSMARRALKNYWWLAVGVTLLAEPPRRDEQQLHPIIQPHGQRGRPDAVLS